MTGQEVYAILVARRVTHLYHANTVKTSLSLLNLRGLASRALVEKKGLPQTHQYTDQTDHKYDIWGDVFMDTVDIHARISKRNQYGPVLFVLTVDVLRSLPATARVLVTRLNPTKWHQTASDSEKYFLSAAELIAGLSIGTFDQMLVIRTNDGIVPFMHYLSSIILDEPTLANGVSNTFNTAASALHDGATASNLQVPINRRLCNPCNCIISYAAPANLIPDLYSLP